MSAIYRETIATLKKCQSSSSLLWYGRVCAHVLSVTLTRCSYAYLWGC